MATDPSLSSPLFLSPLVAEKLSGLVFDAVREIGEIEAELDSLPKAYRDAAIALFPPDSPSLATISHLLVRWGAALGKHSPRAPK